MYHGRNDQRKIVNEKSHLHHPYTYANIDVNITECYANLRALKDSLRNSKSLNKINSSKSNYAIDYGNELPKYLKRHHKKNHSQCYPNDDIQSTIITISSIHPLGIKLDKSPLKSFDQHEIDYKRNQSYQEIRQRLNHSAYKIKAKIDRSLLQYNKSASNQKYTLQAQKMMDLSNKNESVIAEDKTKKDNNVIEHKNEKFNENNDQKTMTNNGTTSICDYQLNSIKTQFSVIENELELLKINNSKLNNNNIELSTIIKRLQLEKEKYIEQNNNFNTQIENYKDQIFALNQSIEEKDKTIKSLQCNNIVKEKNQNDVLEKDNTQANDVPFKEEVSHVQNDQ